MTDLHHFCRRSHAIRRLFERYAISISVAEYEVLARDVQSEAQFHGTNIVKTAFKGRDIYCTIRRGEISTFITPDQAQWSIEAGRRNLAPPRSQPIGTLAEMFPSLWVP
jgi:hypothetical protein